MLNRFPSYVQGMKVRGHKRSTIVKQALQIQKNFQSTLAVKKASQIMIQNTQVKELKQDLQVFFLQVKSFANLGVDQQRIINDQSQGMDVNLTLIPTKEIDIVRSETKTVNSERLPFSRKISFFKLVNHIRQLKNQINKNQKQNFLQRSIKLTNPILLVWNLIKIFIILHTFFSFPLQDTFDNIFYQEECNALKHIFMAEAVFLIIDILLNFHIEQYVNGDLIQKKGEIAKVYMKSDFLLDILSFAGFLLNRYTHFLNGDSCSINIEFQGSVLISLKYLFFFKLRQLSKFFSVVMQEYGENRKFRSYFKLLKLLFQILMVAHIIVIRACIWISVSMSSEKMYKKSWLSDRNLYESEDWFLVYIQAMYYACMTMTTVGYGDILPQNKIEYLVCIMIMLVSCGFFGYTLNAITSMLNDIQRNKYEYKRQVDLLSTYMGKKQIDRTLQKRVKNYLKSMYKSGESDQTRSEKDCLNILSYQLKEELEFNDKGKKLLNIPIFKNYFSINFIKQLTSIIEEEHYSPKDIIVPKISEKFIYVVSGEVEIIFEKKVGNKQYTQVLHTMKKGEFIGLQCLFGEEQRMTLRSKNFSMVYQVSSEKMRGFVMSDQISRVDYEMYCQLRDKSLLQKDYRDFELNCQCCGKDGHDLFRCQQIFYVSNPQYVIRKHNYSIQQGRQQHERPRLKYQSLKHLGSTQLIGSYIKRIIMEESNDESIQMLTQNNNDNDSFILDDINEEDEQSSRQDIQQVSPRSWMLESSSDDNKDSYNMKKMHVEYQQNSLTLIQAKENPVIQRIQERHAHMPRNSKDRRAMSMDKSTYSPRKIFKFIDGSQENHSNTQQNGNSQSQRKNSNYYQRQGNSDSHLDNSRLNVQRDRKRNSTLRFAIDENQSNRDNQIEIDLQKNFQTYNQQNNLTNVLKGYTAWLRRNGNNFKKLSKLRQLQIS